MDSTISHLVRACVIGALLGLISFLLIWRAQPIPPVVSAAWFSPAPTLAPVVSMQSGGTLVASDHPIRLLFVGDVMLDRHVAEKIRTSGDPAYPFRRLPLGWFDSFDFAVANLEGPVTSRSRPPLKSIDFRFEIYTAKTLKDLGIDAISQANNHTLDQGAVGFEESRATLREQGLLVFGHQVRDDEIALATTTVRGVRFAFLGFNTTDNPFDEKAAERVIRQAREQADHVVVFMHWGTEYRNRPNSDVVARAHWLIDRDVDAVIGGHPHWVQGIESYRGKPIAYSLGNFVFDQYFSRETQEGLTVALVFDHGRISVEPIPINMDKSQPRLLDGEEKERRLRALMDISASFP